MSTAFLTTDKGPSGPAALSPFAPDLGRAGARFETRDGWEVATGFGDLHAEVEALSGSVGWADRSQLGKIELQGTAGALDELRSSLGIAAPESGFIAENGTNRWLSLTPERAIVICEPQDLTTVREQLGSAAIDVTASFAAITIAGPLTRDLFSRFCALDLRQREVPVGALRPGSVARVPGIVLCEASDRFTVLFGAAYASYFWEVVTDAGERLGGRPVGADALATAISKERDDA